MDTALLLVDAASAASAVSHGTISPGSMTSSDAPNPALNEDTTSYLC